MFCPKCGNEVKEGTAFCGKCGAPVGGAQEGASGAAGQSAAAGQAVGAAAPKAGSSKVGIAAVAVVVVLVLVVGFATNWFGLGGVQPKEAVEAYTWDELSRISNEIAAAGDEAAAIEVAKRYNLCLPDGTLDGTQVKSVTLANGQTATVQIVGFAHDDKTAGGKAGITFIFGEAIADHPMNPTDTNAGGWEASEMRSWLAGEGMGLLPADLVAVIVPVDKLTNNVGETESVSSVTTTSDSLWLFSSTELCGTVGWYDTQAYNDVQNAQGSEYKLFRDLRVNPDDGNVILVKDLDSEPYNWWARSADPHDSGYFELVYFDGCPCYEGTADLSNVVVPGFCI